MVTLMQLAVTVVSNMQLSVTVVSNMQLAVTVVSNRLLSQSTPYTALAGGAHYFQIRSSKPTKKKLNDANPNSFLSS